MPSKPQPTPRKYETIARNRNAQIEKSRDAEATSLNRQLEIAQKLAAEYKIDSEELGREVQRRKGLIGTYAKRRQMILVAEEKRWSEDPFGVECTMDAEQESESFSFDHHAIYIQCLIDEQEYFIRKYEAQRDLVWQLKVHVKEEKDRKRSDANCVLIESPDPAFESINK